MQLLYREPFGQSSVNLILLCLIIRHFEVTVFPITLAMPSKQVSPYHLFILLFGDLLVRLLPIGDHRNILLLNLIPFLLSHPPQLFSIDYFMISLTVVFSLKALTYFDNIVVWSNSLSIDFSGRFF